MDSGKRVYNIPRNRLALFALGFGCVVLLIVGCRLGYLSSMHLSRGIKAIKAGVHEEAAEAFTWSIRNHFPGNPYSNRAVTNAMDVVAYYRQEGKRVKEKEALQHLRASLYSIRSFYQPYKIELKRIEERLWQLNGNQNES